MRFKHKKIERKWLGKLLKDGIYYPSKMVGKRKKFYNLWMFPYPSAEGLHAGHAFASTGSDVYGRFMRMKGYEVFQPIGYDSFGIHSENFAIKVGKHPKEFICKTTKNYENQLKSLGHAYDWTRTVTTSDIDYYRWTQWLFVQMFKAGLAYRKKSEVNFCPSCKTVLADEQVMTPAQAGKIPVGFKSMEEVSEGTYICERCASIVEKKDLEQWRFRITDYADKLLDGLDRIDWPEKIKIAQRNWIGKKDGITITYPVKESDLTISCWTSRPDTNFGATFVAISPEYKDVLRLTTKENRGKVTEYIKKAKSKSEDEKIEQGKEKTGVFTGLFAINHLTGKEMPIWVTDFVLFDVGTGAVVGVPGHDRRDFEFAEKYDLKIIRVVVGSDGDISPIIQVEQVQEEEGMMINSGFLNGMDTHKATRKIIDYMESEGQGVRTTSYHLRNWIISRQRYWGPPIPMIYCKACAKESMSWFTFKDDTSKREALRKDQSDWVHAGWYPVDEAKLPVNLPDIKDYIPKGEGRGPLADHPEFYQVACPECGLPARRETDVSDTFLDSSWYFLRYPSVGAKRVGLRQDNLQPTTHKLQLPWDEKITKKWLPVDLYFGGAEHAVLHLMYARFVTMVLNDLNYLEFDEPFPRFFAHGLMIKDGAKMSKSRGNVVNPDEYIEKYGADTLRLYLMFMGPMDGYPDFRDTGIEGMRKFVERVWDLFQNSQFITHPSTALRTSNSQLSIKMHQTIKKVTEDIEKFHYNTAISSIMEYVNALRAQTQKSLPAQAKKLITDNLKALALMLAPFAPHLAEEVWVNVLGQKFSVHKASWPEYDPELIVEETVEIPVQVNGKLRATLTVDRVQSTYKKKVVELAKEDRKIAKWLAGRKIKREVFVPGKLVNFVV